MAKKNKDKAGLRKIQPEIWVARINRLPVSIRDQVTNIIWWDFFAERNTTERWHHLDHIIRKRVPVTATDEQLFDALVKCGYSPRLADIRLNRSVNASK